MHISESGAWRGQPSCCDTQVPPSKQFRNRSGIHQRKHLAGHFESDLENHLQLGVLHCKPFNSKERSFDQVVRMTALQALDRTSADSRFPPTLLFVAVTKNWKRPIIIRVRRSKFSSDANFAGLRRTLQQIPVLLPFVACKFPDTYISFPC